jgi:hypothetical protein
MERRYLVATLALVATFSLFSREFRSGHLTNLPRSRAEVVADLKCARKYVTDQIVAKANPFLNRDVPDQPETMAEMAPPPLDPIEERIAAHQSQIPLAPQAVVVQQCDGVERAQEQATRAQEIGARAAELAQERAAEISERAQERAAEMSARAQERAAEMNARMSERAAEMGARAQEIALRATERAQHAVWNSRGRMVPPAPSTSMVAPVAPLPIDFQVSMPADFDPQIQSVVESGMTVKCVRTKVAGQQVRTVMVQRANQNMVKDVRVVVNTQDVSGLTSLTQSPASHSAVHKFNHDLRHLQNQILGTVDRAFATL